MLIAIASVLGLLVGALLQKRAVVPYDEECDLPLLRVEDGTLHEAWELCGRVKDHSTRCYFKGRVREMVRLQPVCDAEEFEKMCADLTAEVDDFVHFGTTFRYASFRVQWDRSRLPHGPNQYYTAGKCLLDIKRLHRVMQGLAKEYGKIFPVMLEGNPLWVVVSGPEEMKAVFHDAGATISSRTFGQAHLIAHTDFPSGNFLRCPFSNELKKRRGICSRALTKQSIKPLRPLLERCRHLAVRAVLREVEHGEAFDPRPLLRMMVVNTLTSILFGITFCEIDDPEFQEVLGFINDEASEPLAGAVDIKPWLRLAPGVSGHTAKAERMKDIRAREDAWLHEKIAARRRHLDSGGEAVTLCDMLLETMQSPCPGQRMSYENIKEICNEIIFAGTDTTSTSTEMVLAHMINSPSKADKLRAELDEVLGGKSPHMPTAADFPRLPYTNSVIKESMRMSSAVPFSGHTCTADTEVLGKYVIPKGALCIQNVYALHYDPEIYPEPEEYRPERWLDKDPCHWNIESNFEFVPFGSGRRLCIGYHLAIENLQLFVASLFSSFKFESETGQPVPMTEITEFTVSLKSFKVRASVREHSAVGRDRETYLELPAPVDQSAHLRREHSAVGRDRNLYRTVSTAASESDAVGRDRKTYRAISTDSPASSRADPLSSP